MTTRFRRILLSSFAALAVAGPIFGLSPAQAADNALSRMIVVSGEGEVSAAPDQAHVSAGVVSQAATAADALAANSTAMKRVFDALHTAGIADAKIQTANFSVSPQFAPYRPNEPQPESQRIIGYQVSNQVAVTVDDLAKLGSTLDALVKSGANSLGGVSFTIANPKPLQERARRAAVDDAVAKAKTLAAAAGVTLGPVLSIQEGGGGIVSPRPLAFAAVRTLAAAAPPPISEGESEVSVNVTMTYAIQ